MQFYEINPDSFLQKSWSDFDECPGLLVEELKRPWRRYYRDRSTLTDRQMVYVSIAYNQGSVNIRGGLNQGHDNYGEHVWEYLQLAKSVT